MRARLSELRRGQLGLEGEEGGAGRWEESQQEVADIAWETSPDLEVGKTQTPGI